MGSLEKVTAFIIEQEEKLRDRILSQRAADLHDTVWRAYGQLCYCKKISKKEAMELLSLVRFGYITGILASHTSKRSIYNIMMNIQPAGLQKNLNRELNKKELETERALFLNKVFTQTAER